MFDQHLHGDRFVVLNSAYSLEKFLDLRFKYVEIFASYSIA